MTFPKNVEVDAKEHEDPAVDIRDGKRLRKRQERQDDAQDFSTGGNGHCEERSESSHHCQHDLHAEVPRPGEDEGGSVQAKRVCPEELCPRKEGVCEEEEEEQVNEADGVAVAYDLGAAGPVLPHPLLLHVADHGVGDERHRYHRHAVGVKVGTDLQCRRGRVYFEGADWNNLNLEAFTRARAITSTSLSD